LSAVRRGLSSAGYTIEREIGAGGMATVYLAHDVRHDRQVAIKILHEDLGASVGSERFFAEIKTTARLQHPHILSLLDSGSVGSPGEPDALLFYVMPFIQGESLRDRLDREKQLPIDEAVRLTREIADALGYAHEQGIVHRDIKPENILLQGGHALVADFGIAIAVQTAGGERLTKAGVSLGTPEYMAPEQASASDRVDRRADIYALGVVAYEMLTGDPPFTGSTLQAIVAKIMTERPVALRTVRDTVPPGVEAAVLTALAKLPADRFSQASDFTRALADLPGVSSGARPAVEQPLPRRTRAPLAISAVAVVLVALAAVLLFRRGPAPIVMGAVTQVTRSTDTLNFDAAISPDGQFVAYAAGTAGRMRLFVRQVSGSAPVPIATGLTGDHRWPRWSPDGSKLAFVANKAIHVIPVLGGVPQLVVNLGDFPGQPSWSPDGAQLAYADSSGISVVPVTGGPSRPVTSTLEAHSPAWSPDGRRIGYVVENMVFTSSSGYGNAAPSSIWTASATGGDSALVTDAAHLNTGPMWWPDGRSILFVSDRDGTRDVYRQAVNAKGRPRGNPDRVTSGLNVFTFTLTRDGSQMAYSTLQLRANIWMAPISPSGTTPSSAARPVTTEKQSVEGIALSHDGKWLAYDSDRNGNLDIFKVPFNGTGTMGDPVALTTDPASDFEPRWSPGDNELVFYSRRFGTKDLFTVRADGRNESRLTDLPGNEYYPDWSPDGQRIAFSSQVSYGWDVFVMSRGVDAAWLAPRRVNSTATATVNVRWAPDGRSIALVSNSTLSLLPVDEGALRPLVDGRSLRETITFVAWARDPSRVYFQTRDSTGVFSFWSAPTAGGSPRRLLRLAEPGRRTRRPEFDTDGRNLFFTVVDDEANVAVVSLKRP
jgi:Tol biopolymer transport system component